MRDQDRAQIAFTRVEAVSHEPGEKQTKYSTRCRQFPALVHRCGLCQAIGFYQSKADTHGRPEAWAYAAFLNDLAQAVLDGQAVKTAEELARQARTKPFGEYHWLSRDALECGNWFKRYAEALLGSGEEG
jgi:CRISPR type III-B/RAMP module-associated protein Cmr5